MLVSNQTLSKIDELVDKAYLYFAITLIGVEFLTEEERNKAVSLGLLALTRPLMDNLYLMARTPIGSKESMMTVMNRLNDVQMPIINDESQYTLDHSKIKIQQALQDTRHELKSRVKRDILDANGKFKEKRALEGPMQDRQSALDDLFKNIGIVVTGGVVAGIFSKQLITAVTDAVNSAKVDDLRLQAAMQNKDTSDLLVFKQVVWDSRLSEECRKLHTHPDGRPRIYTLKQLQANGSNVGKRKSEWKAVIGPTHPNCRCLLKPVTQEMLKDSNLKLES